MKILIIYFSQTGNTEKIAKAISEGLIEEGHEIEIQQVNETQIDILSDYQLIFVGSACHSTDLATPVKKLLDNMPSSPSFKMAGFVTHATADPTGHWTSNCLKTFLKTSIEKSIVFKGYFSCMGVPSPPVQEFIKGSVLTDMNKYSHYIKEAQNHPDEDEIRQAKTYANEIVNAKNDHAIISFQKLYFFI